MRVAVLVDPVPPEGGGGFTFQHEILRSLEEFSAERGHEFVVIGWWPGRKAPAQRVGHVSYIDIHKSRWLNVKVKYWKIRSIIHRVERPLPHFKRTTLAEYYARKAGADIVWHLSPNYGAVDLPFVYTVWDLQHRMQPWFPEVSDLGQWTERDRQYTNVLPRASAVITGTEVGKAEVTKYYDVPPEHVRVVPFPAPAPALISDALARRVFEKYRIPESFLFYPAQFWPHKNHIGLLMALHLLRDHYGLTVPLVLAGSDTSMRKYVEGVIKHFHMQDQVHILGFIPREDRDALYSRALALIMPTYFGPDNLPPLEAFALGCPVIASSVPGAFEQLDDAAILVNPGDENDMALGIKQLVDNPALRDTLITRGRDRALRWNGRDYVNAVLTIFDDLTPFLRCWMPNILLRSGSPQ